MKKIIFIPRRSRIRLFKIAKSIRYTGQYQLICICEEAYYDANLFDGLFDEVHFYKKHNLLSRDSRFRKWNDRLFPNLNNLVQLVDKVNPDLIHAFCEPYDHIVHLLKKTDYPVVLSDGADFSGISTGIDNIPPKTKAEEKYVLEHMHGVCYKGPPHVMHYYRSFGYSINAEEISWFDHCDEDLFEDTAATQKLSAADGETHLVYTGNVSVNPEMKYVYYLPLAEALAKQRIHLHLYPNPFQYQSSKLYIELEKREPYFHWHKPLPLKGLIKEIARYDFGLWIHAADPSSRTQPDKMKTGIGNKLFTYLEAGLPVIVSNSRIFGAEVIEGHGIGFAMDDNDWDKFDKKIGSCNFAALKSAVLAKRQEFSLRNNADRLMEFYEKVMATATK